MRGVYSKTLKIKWRRGTQHIPGFADLAPTINRNIE